MPDITSIRDTLHGIKGVFLLKNGEVLDSDIVFENEIEYLSKIIPYLVEAVCDTKDDIKKMSIVGNNLIFIFFQKPYALGIIGEPSINIPLLEVMAGGVLEQWEVSKPERREKKMKEALSKEGEVTGEEEEILPEEKEIPSSYLKLKKQLLG